MVLAKNYSKLLRQLELTQEEQNALESLKTIPRYWISWPKKGYENLIEPIGRAHAKMAIIECLKEAEELAKKDSNSVKSIYLQNTWFFSFNLFNANQVWCYAYQMNYDLFTGVRKEALRDSFNNYVTSLFGIPEEFKRNELPAWNWMNIVIDFKN